jgi:BNR repeat-like domain
MLRVQLIGILVLSILSLFVLAAFMHGTTFYESGIDRSVTPVLAQQENSNGTMNSTDMKSIVDAAIKKATYYTIENATTPSVAIDPNTGTIYAVYFRNDNSGGNIYLQKSDDSGRTFSQPIRINDEVGLVQLDAQWSAPAIGVGPNSQVYIVWYNADHSEPEKYPYGQVTLRFARSLDGGNTFEAAVNPAPNDPKGEQSYPYMVVSDNNQIHISYLNLDYSKLDDPTGTPTVLRMVSSLDGGTNFANSSIADKSACQCCATVSALNPVDGEIYTSTRSALKNGSISLDNETKTDYMNQEQDLAVIRDVTVSHSTDKGLAQSFSEVVPVNDDRWFMNGCPDAGPGMAFDNSGRLHIAWFTGSETGENGQGFYYASSDDQAKTFSKPVPIHLLSEQWIPPTTQYLATDAYDNSWVVFVNSEGLEKSPTYEEDFSFIGNGTVQLAVVDNDGNVVRNVPFAMGEITKHYPYTSGGKWQDSIFMD